MEVPNGSCSPADRCSVCAVTGGAEPMGRTPVGPKSYVYRTPIKTT